MFGQLLFVRIKAAEKALREGRLEEAHRLAAAPDIRAHRRGEAVLAKLAGLFLDRAREHYRAERFDEARSDLDRAASCGEKADEVVELRKQVETVAAEVQRNEISRHARLEQARRRIEHGSLAAGRAALENASENDPAARQLRREVEERGAELDRLVGEARHLVEEAQWAAAADRVRRGKGIEPSHTELQKIESRLCERVLAQATASLQAGKLSRAEFELGFLAGIGEGHPGRRELEDALGLAREAGRELARRDFDGARRRVMSLARLLNHAPWLREVTEQLRVMDETMMSLQAGPLADLANLSVAGERGRPTPAAGRAAKPAAKHDETLALPGRAEPPDSGLLLLVDGGGSYLILRSPQVTIGRAASSRPAEIALFGDIGDRHANIARAEDDYFVFGAQEVEVGGRPTRHQLLRDGDRIVFGRKAKLTFRLPSRRSASAVLDLSDTTKMPNDVRRVVLFDGHATIGQGPTAHFPCRHAGVPLILFERAGELWIRPKNDGHVAADPVAVQLGTPMEVAGVSFVVQPWSIRGPAKTV